MTVGRKTKPATEPTGADEPNPPSRLGLLLGMGAVLCWSFGSSLVFLGARQTGPWLFVALSSLTGAALQLVWRRLSRGELRSALWLPWRLWTSPVCCFVLYGLVWPWALATSTARQVVGVNLINYLWPILTVVLSAWWVPGVRLTGRLIGAMLLAVAGLALANLPQLRQMLSSGSGAGSSPGAGFLPYSLALLAAVAWGAYSASLARWRDWAKDYVTSPLSFLIIGAIASVIVAVSGSIPPRLAGSALCMTFLYGAGPLAAGYLLWEMALPRARVQTLGLLAAAIPVLSTCLLCVVLKKSPGPELIAAALLVGGGVVLSLRQ
jgi:drug/metabolite transporter (DMT)-like permease